MDKIFEQILHKNYMWMINHIKKCSTSLIFGEIQNKIVEIRWTIANVLEAVECLELSYIVMGLLNGSTALENCLTDSWKVKHT